MIKNNNIYKERDKFLKKKLQIMSNDYNIKLTPKITAQIMTDLSDIYEEGKSKGWEEGYHEGYIQGQADVGPDNYTY